MIPDETTKWILKTSLALALACIAWLLITDRAKRSARAEVATELATAHVAAGVCAAVLTQVDNATGAEAAKAEAVQARATEAATQAADAADRARADIAAAARALLNARLNPTCMEQLEVRLCDAIPLL